MARTKRMLAGAAGVAIGLVTLRRFRRRRRDPRKEAQTEAKKALTEASQAAEHSAAALEHARVAGEKAAEVAGDAGVPGIVDRTSTEQTPQCGRGIRSRAKRLIRR